MGFRVEGYLSHGGKVRGQAVPPPHKVWDFLTRKWSVVVHSNALLKGLPCVKQQVSGHGGIIGQILKNEV